LSIAHQVRYAIDATTAQTANLRTYRRTNPTGPIRPSASDTAPKTSAQSQRASKPKTRSERAAAAVEMMISSNVDQPRFCATFSTVGA
jgi:hypothetical protein